MYEYISTTFCGLRSASKRTPLPPVPMCAQNAKKTKHNIRKLLRHIGGRSFWGARTAVEEGCPVRCCDGLRAARAVRNPARRDWPTSARLCRSARRADMRRASPRSPATELLGCPDGFRRHDFYWERFSISKRLFAPGDCIRRFGRNDADASPKKLHAHLDQKI